MVVYDIIDDFNIIIDDPNDKYLLDQVQDGYMSWNSLTWPSNRPSKIGSS